MPSGWSEANAWERDWWGDCCNTYAEEVKQFQYASRMGLRVLKNEKDWPYFDLAGKSVLDMGGGPCSLLLKCVNRGRCAVVDPCPFPPWVRLRYQAAGLRHVVARGEDGEAWEPAAGEPCYDEAWIYNCLQHTEDPARIVANVRRAARLIRLCEWIDTPACPGHPQTLTEASLNAWLHGEGRVEVVGAGAWSKWYYGVFPT